MFCCHSGSLGKHTQVSRILRYALDKEIQKKNFYTKMYSRKFVIKTILSETFPETKSYCWYFVDEMWGKCCRKDNIANKVTKLHINEICYSWTYMLPRTPSSRYKNCKFAALNIKAETSSEVLRLREPDAAAWPWAHTWQQNKRRRWRGTWDRAVCS
jgi:hypothetical protein